MAIAEARVSAIKPANALATVHKCTYNGVTIRMGQGEGAGECAKHGVDFADVVVALEDGFAVTVPDPDFHAEERFVTIGRDATGRLVVVIHAARGTNVKIISARPATRKERSSYEG